jgi:hypothetical protein
MLNIKFRKQDGPEMNLYLVEPSNQPLVVSALSMSGYIVGFGKEGNPWEGASRNRFELIQRKDGSPLLLAEDYQAAKMVMGAVDLYSPNFINGTVKTIERPIHYESDGEW